MSNIWVLTQPADTSKRGGFYLFGPYRRHRPGTADDGTGRSTPGFTMPCLAVRVRGR